MSRFWISVSVALTIAASSPAVSGSCAQAVAQCQIEGANKNQIVEKCEAAGERCKKTGMFVGPITGKKWNVPKR
jgi:hypothetical protein